MLHDQQSKQKLFLISCHTLFLQMAKPTWSEFSVGGMNVDHLTNQESTLAQKSTLIGLQTIQRMKNASNHANNIHYTRCSLIFLLYQKCNFFNFQIVKASFIDGGKKRLLKSFIQISVNNLTLLRYSKKTQYSAIIQVQISSRIGGYYSTQVIFESQL